MSILKLPPETLLMIVSRLDRLDIRNIRASCQYLRRHVTPLCFQTVQFELHEKSLARLHNISLNEELRQYVKTLILRRSHGLLRFPCFSAWEESISRGSNSSDETAPNLEWLALSVEDRKSLYEEYESDISRAISLKDHLHFGMYGCERCDTTFGQVHPANTTTNTLLLNALKDFDNDIARFSNVTTFIHEPAYIYDDDWGTHWRNLRLDPKSIVENTGVEDDEDLEALQLSYVLRAFGRGRGCHRNLRSFRFYVGGPAFWGVERLRRLWNSEEESIRSLRRTWHEVADEIAVEDSRDSPNDSIHLHIWELYLRQLFLMENAFLNVTQLDCTISDDSYALNSAVESLHQFLRQGRNLEQVRLVLGDLAFGALDTGYDRAGKTENATKTLFTHLSRDLPWPWIQELELEVVTNQSDLVQFLATLAETLSQLTLTRVTLVRSGGKWESTLREIATRLNKLEALRLLEIRDYTPDLRVSLDANAQIWHAASACYEHYERTISCCLLSQAHYIPQLDATAFLEQHRQTCQHSI